MGDHLKAISIINDCRAKFHILIINDYLSGWAPLQSAWSYGLLFVWYYFKNMPLLYYAAHGVTSIIKLPNSSLRLFITFSFQLLQFLKKIQRSVFHFLFDPSKQGQSKQVEPQTASDAAGPEARDAWIGVLWAPCCGHLFPTVQNHKFPGLSNGIICPNSVRWCPE